MVKLELKNGKYIIWVSDKAIISYENVM